MRRSVFPECWTAGDGACPWSLVTAGLGASEAGPARVRYVRDIKIESAIMSRSPRKRLVGRHIGWCRRWRCRSSESTSVGKRGYYYYWHDHEY